MAGVTFARRTLLPAEKSRFVTSRHIGFERRVDSQSQNVNISAREVEFTDTEKHGRRVVCPASQEVIDQQRQLRIKLRENALGHSSKLSLWKGPTRAN
jgi:hypothetical protein